MHLLTGGALGLVAGLGVWQIACRFVHRAREEGNGADQGTGALCEPRGILSLPSAAVLGGMILWGAYVGWRTADLVQLFPSLVVTGLLVTISWVDLSVRRIPNPLLLALLAWAVLQALWLGKPTAVEAFLGLLVGGGLFLLLALLRRGALGAGDVKLAAVLGTVVGLPLVLPALLSGALAGGLAALLLLATRRVGRRDYMAYGPYLSLGAWLVWTQAIGLWP
jgi:Flp pilus assembly protein protease CpaA